MIRLRTCVFAGLVMGLCAVLPLGAVATEKAQGGQSAELTEALQRIDQLEAQIVEMQSVIGALQSLLKKGVAVSSPQEQGRYSSPRNQDFEQPKFQSDGWGADTRSDFNQQPGFGTPPADFAQDGQPPSSRARVNGQSARALYDAGYNYMMASDYKSAEATFKAFLANHPKNELSGHAQFLLGEVYFQRGEYNLAANEFLKGYKSYRRSPKAPNSLLKLGMSLEKLGQVEAACQTYRELSAKYKRLPGHMMRKLSAAQDQAGCKI